MNDNVEEVSLKDIINEIIYSKLVILICLILVILIGFIFHNNQQESWKSEIEIKKLNIIDHYNYINIFESINKMKKTIFPANKVNELNLIELLYSEIIDKEEVITYLKKSIFPNIDTFSNKNEIYLKELSYKFNIKAIEENNALDSINISFEHQNLNLATAIIEYVIVEANSNVSNEFKNIIESSTDDYQRYFKQKVKIFETEIENLMEQSKKTHLIKIQFLKDQAKIARLLNIADNSAQSITFDTAKSDTVTAIATTIGDQYYLRGYKAIEKELELLSKKILDPLFLQNDKIFELQNDLASFQLINFAEDLNYYFDKLPSNNGNNFKSADYDLSSIEITDQRMSLRNILAFSVLIWLALSFLYICSKLIYKKI